ncbi:MAG: sigma-70 family RNA polymerase sigma factor [Candidatus Sericytochromatia bacterium]|nr:sigma-70 family RNA polymerase sigma factor [Candidatus Sericytochromatia bacterium]
MPQLELSVPPPPAPQARALLRRDPLPDADAALVARAQDGDMKALEALFRRHHGPIHQLVHRMVHGAPEAEDLVQEAFLKAFRGLGGFRRHSSFKTWLYQIATNTCLNHLARAERRYQHDSLDATLGEEGGLTLGERLEAHGQTPEEAATAAEVYRQVERALAQLSPEFRAVLVLRDVQDLSYEEIAESLGINLGTVKSRLARARRQVQQHLGELR